MGIANGSVASGNQADVLELFDQAGFEVCVQQVCPSRAGIPMTRQRIHYIGLCRDKVKDAAAQVQSLQSAWNAVVAGGYPLLKLADFLEPASTEIPGAKAERKADERTDRKWTLMHKEVFLNHEV